MKAGPLRTSVILVSTIGLLLTGVLADAPLNSRPAAHNSANNPSRILTHPHFPLHGLGALYIRVKTPHGITYISRDRFYQIVDIDGTADDEPVASINLPVGSVIIGLPNDFSTLLHEGSTLFYHEGVFFSQKDNDGFQVIEAPVGAIIKKLPTYAESIRKDGIELFKYMNTVYSPINQYGETVFEVTKAKDTSNENLESE